MVSILEHATREIEGRRNGETKGDRGVEESETVAAVKEGTQERHGTSFFKKTLLSDITLP